MNIKKRIAAGIVFGWFALFAATGGFAAEGKVTMDQWLKIINPVGAKEAPPGQTGKTADTDTHDSAKPEKVAQEASIPDLQDVVPFALQEPLDIHTLSVAQYQGAVTAAMETFRLTMGELSPDDEKRFNEKWGAYFDYPTPESVAYFNKLNPLLVEFLSLRAAVATAAVEFDGAWEEAVIAAGYESENGIREGLAIAEMQKNQLLTMQARLEQVVKEITAIGNPPDVQ